MPDRNPQALDFLLTRRSRPAKTLEAPVPERAELETILTAAARSPDHGKLEPWRFVVLERAVLDRLAGLAAERGAALGKDSVDIAKAVDQFDQSPLAVVVVSAPTDTDRIPEIEQILSAGCVCLQLVNAALASGWGACWLTGWAAYDRPFVEQGLGLTEGERVAGIVHIGTERVQPPDRPRPDLAAKVTWLA